MTIIEHSVLGGFWREGEATWGNEEWFEEREARAKVGSSLDADELNFVDQSSCREQRSVLGMYMV